MYQSERSKIALEKKKKAEEIEEQNRQFATLPKVFQGPDGEAALELIDKFCNYKNNAWNIDPYKHAFLAGQRSVPILIHTIIEQGIEKARESGFLNAEKTS